MDMLKMMKQAKQMQEKMAGLQEEVAQIEVIGTSGGGLVRVTLSGKGDLKALSIDPSLVKPEDAEIIEDLIVAAHADAKRKLDEVNNALMREAAGPMAGMNIPGMPKLF